MTGEIHVGQGRRVLALGVLGLLWSSVASECRPSRERAEFPWREGQYLEQ